MKRISGICIVAICTLIYSCESKKTNKNTASKITIDNAMLDSIKVKADTTYSKRYPRTDLVTAEYFVSKKDSTIMQVMKDSAANIRQVIIERNRVRYYTAAFYPNGQLVAKYNLDNFGQYTDSSKEYYENGFIRSEGLYKSGFHVGKWKMYDSTGKYINTAEYNVDGQQVKTSE